MEEFILIRPTIEYAKQIAEYRQEFLDISSSMDGTGPLKRISNPYEYIKVCLDYEDPLKVPSGLVAATQFLFIHKSDNRLIGMIQVRHHLNDYLAKYGGHIGYSIRPSERSKGYATKMLNMTLAFLKEIAISKVLLTCIEDNIASEKVILANDGIYEYTIYEANKDINLKRFWISL